MMNPLLPFSPGHRPHRMTVESTVTGRPWWRSAIKGGLIALLAPIPLGLIFAVVWGSDAGVGLTWMFLAAILAAPILFALGAVGGVAVHAVRGERPGASRVLARQTSRVDRVAWQVAGGLAGFVASWTTLFQWPIIGGALIGMALIPVWIWIGVAFARRVSMSGTVYRRFVGALIFGAAGYAFTSLAWDFARIGSAQSARTAPIIGGGLVCLAAYWRLGAYRKELI
jgi:hypothetical protein